MVEIDKCYTNTLRAILVLLFSKANTKLEKDDVNDFLIDLIRESRQNVEEGGLLYESGTHRC